MDLLIGRQIFINVFERRGWRDWLENTEAKSMSLFGLMIRILANYNNLYFIDWSGFKSIENMLFLRINL